MKITSLVVQFIPLASFCSILSLFLTTGSATLLSLAGMMGTFVAGLAAVALLYCLVLLVFERLNPKPFILKYMPVSLQAFSLASSSAAIPLNMEACQQLGIPSKIYSLSIPLGATVNMNGTCIYLSVVGLSLAKMYGVEISSAAMTSMCVSILVLSVGAPGVLGAGLVCLSMLLGQLGVPIEAVGLVMGIDPLIGMARVMSNCLGDVAGSLVVASREKMLDVRTYNAL